MKRLSVSIILWTLTTILVVLNVYLWQVQERKKTRLEGLQSQIALHQRENKNLLDRNNDLNVEVQNLRSPESLASYEEKARENYGLIGKNETFFVLPRKELERIPDIKGLDNGQKDLLLSTKIINRNLTPFIQQDPPKEQTSEGIEPIAVSPVPLQLESLSP